MYFPFVVGLLVLYARYAVVESVPDKCDTEWQEKYSKFHADMLKSENPRLIVAVPHASGEWCIAASSNIVVAYYVLGIADRMVGLATVFMMGVLSNRAFQIGRRENLPNLELAFDAPHINWTRTQDPWWVLEPVTHRQRITNYDEKVINSNEYFALNLIENIRMQDQVLTKNAESLISHNGMTKTSIVSANKGLLTRYYDNPVHQKQFIEMHLDIHNSFGCVINYLFKPKMEIFDPMKEQYEIMTNPDPKVLKIGIQIRVGDWMWTNVNHTVNLNVDYHTFFSCAQQIEDFAMKSGNYTSALWYLTTESMPLRLAALEQYGKKLVTATNVVIDHSAKEGSVCHGHCVVDNLSFKTAAAEWWLLGHAEYHVITKNSGYGRSAGFRSLNRDKIYTVHSGRSPMTCDANSFRPLENHAYDWSGIRI